MTNVWILRIGRACRQAGISLVIASWLLGFSAYGAYVPGEIIIKFKEGVRAAETSPSIENLNKRFKAEKMERGIIDIGPKNLQAERVRIHDLSKIYRVKLPRETDIPEAAKEYQKDPSIEYAEPNYIYRAQLTPNDPRYGSQWGLLKIEAPTGWDITTGEGATIKVADLDTGVNYNHEDLNLAGKVELGLDYVNGDANPMDDNVSENGHGTHVAGIIGAVTNNGVGIAGTSWTARILAIKVLDAGGNGNSLDIANGINYAINHGAQILNMSFGESVSSSTIKDATDNANEAGILMVAAAGNNDSSLPFYPAAIEYIISVAATDQTDQRSVWSGGASSNYGTTIDVCAPGTAIYSTVLSGTYQNKSGTSMAAPFVCGLAALVMARNPSFTAVQTRERIISTCDNIDALNPGYAGLLGAGRINMARALGKPVATLTAPAANSYNSGTVTITGTSIGSEFDHYNISLGLTTSSILEVVHVGRSQVNNGTLYQLNSIPYADGYYKLKLESVNPSAFTTEATVNFNIDNTPPTTEITSPAEGATVSGDLQIYGTASDAVFSYYLLEYRKSSEAGFIHISSSGTAVTSGKLGTWNTTGLAGNYVLRLSARDQAGNTASLTKNLIIGAGTQEAKAEVTSRSAASPNPFNPLVQRTTYLTYNLADNYATTIYLFDLSGNLVWQKSFAAGEQGGKAGLNLAPWNGSSQFGEVVPNGVYLFKIVAQVFGQKKVIGSGKVIVLR
jgi:thermitase